MTEVTARTFIIGTHSFLVRAEIDAQWHVQQMTVLDTNHHYGTGIHSDHVLAIKRNDNQLDQPILSTYTNDVRSTRLASTSIADTMRDVHQIACANGGTYFANTGCNSLTFVGDDGQTRHECRIGNVDYDVNHLNSVFPCGNQLFALFHNRLREDGELVIFDHDFARGIHLRQRFRLWHSGIHNVYIDGKHLYYNASSNGRFIVVDLATERVVQSLSFPGHTKGLAILPDHIVIGFAEHTTRTNRFTAKGFLGVIDPRTWATRAIVDLNHPSLPGPIGNVNEVRIVSEPDQAHARSQPFTNIDWQRKRFAQGDSWHRVRTFTHTNAKRIRKMAIGSTRNKSHT